MSQSYESLLNTVHFNTYGVIEGYLNTLKSRFGVNINFHDLSGISTLKSEIEKIMAPYLYHNNSFCNYVKKNAGTFGRCVLNKDRLCVKCRKLEAPFYGSCYMGLQELVYPVFVEKELIAVICVGQFYTDEASARSILKRNADRYGLDYAECEKRFFNTAGKVSFDMAELCYSIGMLSEYVKLFYSRFSTAMAKPGHGPRAIDNTAQIKENYIVQKTLEFIRENYEKNLTLGLLASNCYCNPSYLSHIFKTKMKTGVMDYINMTRINYARQLLDVTQKSITEIAFCTGYNDSGYFARVFKQITGLSPKEYRERKI